MATIVTRSGKGSPLTHAEVDANFTNLNTDKLELSGGTMTGNLSFGDNDKAIFGAGSDLQIYHDGSNSYVRDVGTGVFLIQGDSDIWLQNSAGTASYARFTNGGAATLYHNNAAKLATTSTGVDITGTAVTDGVTSSGNIEIAKDSPQILWNDTAGGTQVDYSAYANGGAFAITDVPNSYNLLTLNSGSVSLAYQSTVKLATTSTGVDITGTASVDNLLVDNAGKIYSLGQIELQVDADNNQAGTYIGFSRNNTTSERLALFEENGDISFYEDTGTTAKFFWDASAERLGINNASPSVTLDVSNNSSSNNWINASQSARFYQEDSSNPASIKFQSADNANGGQITWGAVAGDGPFMFKNYGTERMRIDSSGNVGIGTSSVGYTDANRNTLQVNGSTSSIIALAYGGTNAGYMYADSSLTQLWSEGTREFNLGTASAGPITFKTNNTERMRIDSSGNVGIGTSSPTGKLHLQGSTGGYLELKMEPSADTDVSSIAFRNAADNQTKGYVLYDHTSNYMGFRTNGSGEAMRITSGGNLLVGTTLENVASSSTETGVRMGDGFLQIGRSNSDILILNRQTSDGDIALFRKDGTTVGSIGNSSTNLIVEATASNRSGLSFGGSVTPRRGGANSDNAVDLGIGSIRFKDLYLSGGVYLGGTGAANKLDDYEETNSSVTFGASTSGTVTLKAAYNEVLTTKIGHIVHVQGGLHIDTVSSPVGVLTITMPFTFKDGPDGGGKIGGAVSFYDDSAGTWSVLPIDAGEGTTTLFIQKDASTVASNDRVYINISYRTT